MSIFECEEEDYIKESRWPKTSIESIWNSGLNSIIVVKIDGNNNLYNAKEVCKLR